MGKEKEKNKTKHIGKTIIHLVAHMADMVECRDTS